MTKLLQGKKIKINAIAQINLYFYHKSEVQRYCNIYCNIILLQVV